MFAPLAGTIPSAASLLRTAFTTHGGREEGTEGDSFFVVFDNPLDAVMAAMETDAAADAMANDGVLPETLVFLVEA